MKRAMTAGVGFLLAAVCGSAQEVSRVSYEGMPLAAIVEDYARFTGKRVECVQGLDVAFTFAAGPLTLDEYTRLIEAKLRENNIGLFPIASNRVVAAWIDPGKAGPSSEPTSYAERLRSRRETRDAASPAGPGRIGPRDLEKRLRDSNMRRVRAKEDSGLPAPVPLTEEEDAQLVKDGVLPPREKDSPREKTQPPAGGTSTNRADAVREPPKP